VKLLNNKLERFSATEFTVLVIYHWPVSFGGYCAQFTFKINKNKT